MFGFFDRKKSVELYAPIAGKVIDITEVPNTVFSQKMMGDGIAIEPVGDIFTAPCDGTIALISETKHAVALITADGLEVLIHIGIDTVDLNGRAFDVHVKVNDEVKRGDRLVTVDREWIERQGKSLLSPILVINMDKVKKLNKYLGASSGKIFTIKIQ